MEKPDTPAKPALTQTDRSAITNLAYRYWQERGGPIGSPEEDWYRAERELRQRGGG
jgi:Protein of unknown function (DUF2934)